MLTVFDRITKIKGYAWKGINDKRAKLVREYYDEQI
jgi:hypothetical protein